VMISRMGTGSEPIKIPGPIVIPGPISISMLFPALCIYAAKK